ncbi:MAG: PAS domain S-box protein [bacterium]|nr:PAS domain S-box protein [bacterium]
MKYKYKLNTVTRLLRHDEVPDLETSSDNDGAPSEAMQWMDREELEQENRQLRESSARVMESHNKYFELYDMAPMAYLTVTKKGLISEINLTGANMMGAVRHRLLHRAFVNFVGEDYHEACKSHYREVFRTGEKQTCELKLERKDGSSFIGHLESACVYSYGTYQTDKCRTTISDITLRKRMEDALRESKLKNLAILNTIPDVILIQDNGGIFIDYHAANVDNPVIAPKEFLGKRAEEVLPLAIAGPLNQLFKKTLETGKIHAYDYSLPHGELLRFYETRMVRLGGDKVLSIVRDITRQKQAERALQSAHNMLEKRVAERTAEVREINRQLKLEIRERKKMEKKRQKEQRMETIGRLASGVAHEVRNPLNSIQAIIAVLNQDLADNKEFQSCSTHINTQVKRLAQLMKDLLELGKEKRQEEHNVLSLHELCRSAITLWKQTHRKKANPTVFEFAPGTENINIKCDQGKLQQVFVNLMDNASQHSPKNAEIKIEILEPLRKYVRIQVADSGTGIKSEHLSQVFEPFFTKRHTGTGLGLSIVKHIVENHSGLIKVKNNDPLPGCTFEISLPREDE